MQQTVASCLILKIDWPTIAQMLTAIAAVVALILGPWLAFNASRRLAVAQSRQQWLDALRDDIAELVALHEAVVVSQVKARIAGEAEKNSDVEMLRISTLLVKVRSRLNIYGNDDHKALNLAINSFVTTYDQKDPEYNLQPVVDALDCIRNKVWADIKRARV